MHLFHSVEIVGTPESPCIFLEIGGQAGVESLQIPLVVRNLSSEVVTLEVKSPLDKVISDNLHSRVSSIHLRLRPQSSMSVMKLQINITSPGTNKERR